MPAVNSGRSVTWSPARSSNEYISFDTTSVVSPIVRANTAVGSSTGTSTRRKPYRRRTRSNVATTCAKRSASSPSMLCMPRMGCGVWIFDIGLGLPLATDAATRASLRAMSSQVSRARALVRPSLPPCLARRSAQNSAPQPLPIVPTIPAARDIPYPGTMQLQVDATDLDQHIFRVRQTIPVPAAGRMTLLMPQWLPGNHAPRGQIEKLAGLVIRAGGQELTWKRDPVDMYAFHVDVPAGVPALDVSFQFLSATQPDQGRVVVTREMLNLQWEAVSLYPAGYFTRRIPVSASVTYPAGWQAATALRPVAASGRADRHLPDRQL